MLLQRAVKAQEALYEGAIPINVAVAILIRRPSPNALDDACRYFCSCFQRPAWVERETEYAWLMWKQTLPITVGNLLAQPFPRRHVYLSDEAVAFTGCVMSKSQWSVYRQSRPNICFNWEYFKFISTL